MKQEVYRIARDYIEKGMGWKEAIEKAKELLEIETIQI